MGSAKWVDWEPGKIEGCWNITWKLRTIKARTGGELDKPRLDVMSGKCPFAPTLIPPQEGLLERKAAWLGQKCGAVFLQQPQNHSKVFQHTWDVPLWFSLAALAVTFTHRKRGGSSATTKCLHLSHWLCLFLSYSDVSWYIIFLPRPPIIFLSHSLGQTELTGLQFHIQSCYNA